MKLSSKKRDQISAPRLSDAPGDDLDREIARQMSDGSLKALVRFVERHTGYLYRHLQRRFGPGNDTLIETVVRSTLMSAFRKRGPYARGTARTPMRLWLLRLSEREVSRRSALSRRVISKSNVSEELVELREAIATLPREQQAALSMALFDGLSTEEIAGALGVRQARAMRILRAALRRTGSKMALAHAEVP